MTRGNTDVSVVMFDDQQERQSLATLLEETAQIPVDFVNLEKKNVLDEVQSAVERLSQPSLVLVDHILTKATADSSVHKGTSIVAILREKWPEPPVIAVTAAYRECVKELVSDVYEAIFPIERFSDLVAYVLPIVEGYDVLRHEVTDLAGLTNALGAPDAEKEAIRSSVPSAVKRSMGQTASTHYIFRWFRNTFHRKAGFLLDRRWTALSLGVAEKYFDRYEQRIEEAKYTGIFTDSANPRWWKARLYSLLLPESPRRFGVALQEAAQVSLSIAGDHLSRCYRCNEKWPEVLGHVDEASLDDADMRPLHLRCSCSHPLATPEPFYEERRVMLGD